MVKNSLRKLPEQVRIDQRFGYLVAMKKLGEVSLTGLKRREGMSEFNSYEAVPALQSIF